MKFAARGCFLVNAQSTSSRLLRHAVFGLPSTAACSWTTQEYCHWDKKNWPPNLYLRVDIGSYTSCFSFPGIPPRLHAAAGRRLKSEFSLQKWTLWGLVVWETNFHGVPSLTNNTGKTSVGEDLVKIRPAIAEKSRQNDIDRTRRKT